MYSTDPSAQSLKATTGHHSPLLCTVCSYYGSRLHQTPERTRTLPTNTVSEHKLHRLDTQPSSTNNLTQLLPIGESTHCPTYNWFQLCNWQETCNAATTIAGASSWKFTLQNFEQIDQIRRFLPNISLLLSVSHSSYFSGSVRTIPIHVNSWTPALS